MNIKQRQDAYARGYRAGVGWFRYGWKVQRREFDSREFRRGHEQGARDANNYAIQWQYYDTNTAPTDDSQGAWYGELLNRKGKVYRRNLPGNLEVAVLLWAFLCSLEHTEAMQVKVYHCRIPVLRAYRDARGNWRLVGPAYKVTTNDERRINEP